MRPSASLDNTLLNLLNSSYPTQPHSIIANKLIQFYLYINTLISHALDTSPTPTDPKLQFHSSCQVKTTFSDGNGIKKSLKKNTVEPPLRLPIKWSGDVPSPPFPLKIVVAYM